MSTPAGGVALVATLDYSQALAALESFKAQVQAVENSGANISKLGEGMTRASKQIETSLAGMQAVAAELDVAVQKTNELTAARVKEGQVAAEVSAEEVAAGKRQSDQMRETAAQYIQEQKAQVAAAKQRAAETAAVAKAAAAEEVAARKLGLQQVQAEQIDAARTQMAADEAAAAAAQLETEERKLGLMQLRALQIDAARTQMAADEAAAAAAKAETEERKLGLLQLQAQQLDAARTQLAADEVAAAAAKADLEERKLGLLQLQAQQMDVAREQIAAQELAAAAAKADLEERKLGLLQLQAQQMDAARTQMAADEAAAAAAKAETEERKLGLLQVQALEMDSARTRAAQLEILRAEAAAEKELAAIETSRNADLIASARYLTGSDGARLKMLQSIAEAEKLSGTKVSDNPSLAAKFPSAAVGDYTLVGAAQHTAHQLAADLEAVGEAGGKAAIGFHATAGTAREFTTIMKDLFTGEWSRMAASVTRLLTISGTFDGILSVMGLSLFAAGTATALLAAAAIKGAQEQEQLNLALAMTGDLAGTTVSGLEEIAAAAAHAGGTIGSAKEVVLELAQSGRFTADQIKEISTSAGLLQEAGGNVANFVKQVEAIKDNPTDAIYKLNEQYHFLTAATYEAIATAERHGDAVKAAGLAVDDFSSAMADRTKDVVANQGLMLAGWMEMKKLISETIDALEGLGRKSSIGEQIAKLQADIASDKAQGSYQDGVGGVHLVDTSAKENQLFYLQEQLKYEENVAKAKGESAEKTRLQVQAERLLDAERKKVASPADKRAAEEARLRQGLAPLVGLPADQGGITQQDVDDLVAKANAKYHDKKTPRGHIDPTDYNAAQEQAKLDAAALKIAQDHLSILKAMGLAIDEAKYANIEDLQITAEKSGYEASRQKILKEIQNAERNGNAGSKQSLLDSLDGLARQHQAKLTQIQLDYEEQEVLRATQSALLNINTVLGARTSILKDLNTLYGTANGYDQNALDNAAELATVQRAQFDQAVQYQQLKQSGASQEELALARQANVLNLATQIYAIEQERQRLLMDNATSLANIYQQTLNAVEQQIAAIEKGRTTLADQVVSGFSSGTVKANQSLFDSFRSPDTASKYTLRDYTSNIGGGIYSSITSQLSKSMAESQLQGIQDLLKAVGATSNADSAREQAQKDLAINTKSMTDALNVTIPDLLKQLIGLANGTITPSGPVGNAALNGGATPAASQPSATTGSGAPYGFSSPSSANATAMSKQLDAANQSMTDFGKTGTDTFNMLGMNATQFTSLFYTGVVAATSGGKDAFKNFAAYAITQLLALYAIQKLVGLATAAFNASSAGASTPADLISGYTGTGTVTLPTPGFADGTDYIDSKGYVTAPGGSRDDTAIVALSHGEAVLNADAVKRLGRRRIDAVNKGASRFADGGTVGDSPYAGGSSSGGGNMSVAISVDASSKGGSQTDTQKAAQSGQLTKELEAAVLSVFSKYSQPGGQIYTQIKQLTR